MMARNRGLSPITCKIERRGMGKKLIVILIVLVASIGSTDRAYGCEAITDELRNAVQDLGVITTKGGWQSTLKLLSETPVVSACLLVSELREVSEQRLIEAEAEASSQAMHVVWVIRSLQYITGGIRFYGDASGLIGNDQRGKFLTRLGKERVPFFSVWMSRDVIFFSPAKVQREIIEKWKYWYDTKGIQYNYFNAEDLNDWFF